MRQTLTDAYQRARIAYPLVGIYECPPKVFRKGSLVDVFCRGWEKSGWITDDDEYARHAQQDRTGNVAGHACQLQLGEKHGFAVFLMRDPKVEEPVGSAVLFASFAHELGHVDDMANGINLRANRKVDMSLAEEYAHHFACRFILETANRTDHFPKGVPLQHMEKWQDQLRDRMRHIMAFYLDEMLPNLAEVPVASIGRAAANVLTSEEFKEYRKFAPRTVTLATDV